MRKSVQFTQALRSWMDISMNRSMHSWSHHAKATGLSMPQFSILMQMYYRGDCGISDISDRFEISSAAASQHVDNLVQAGLVERAEDPHDRRVKKVQLSAKGRNLIDKGIQERYHWINGLSDSLDEKDQEKIADALVILTEAVRRQEPSK